MVYFKEFMLTKNSKFTLHKGFTIVELLIVVVVIGIIAAITLVGYNGVQDNAKRVATKSELSSQVDKVKLEIVGKKAYPVSLAAASLPTTSGDVAFTYTRNAAGDGFCLTALYEGSFAFHQQESGSIEEGPCDGHSGGVKYCPTDTFKPINGFYCDGSVGGIATLNTNAVKLLATSSPVPAGAPGAYVGRQMSRDNLIGATFPVTPGETYCIEGWASTVSSTVTHALGLMYSNGSTSSWAAVGSATPAQATNQWMKIKGCHTVQAGIINARFWTQNNGVAGSTADVAWYHTALRFWKQ